LGKGKGNLEKFFLVLEREGFKLPPEFTEKLEIYHSLLLDWGKKLPLVSKRDLGEGLLKHYYDALGLSRFVREGDFVDLGTGAGLPGIPLSIFRPNLRGALLDVNLKKTTFLKLAVTRLDLSERLKVMRTRWEEVNLSVDFVISKATGQKEDIRKHLSHLLKPGGTWIRFAQKNENPGPEEKEESFSNPFRKAKVRLIFFVR